MLPASNRGVGMNLCFPDVCNTPTPAGPVPIPYPNIALNAQAVGFSTVVKVSMMNALNLGSKIPMTSGDEAGSAGPIKGAGAYTMGNPLVKIDKMPAINLTSLATGNNGNAAVGAAIVPSVVNVFYTRLPAREAGGAPFLEDVYRRTASVDEASALTTHRSVGVERSLSRLTFQIAELGPEVPGRVFAEIERTGFDPDVAIVLDVRQCPGGELDAFLRLAEIFLPEGAVLARPPSFSPERYASTDGPRSWAPALTARARLNAFVRHEQGSRCSRPRCVCCSLTAPISKARDSSHKDPLKRGVLFGASIRGYSLRCVHAT